MVIYFAGNGNKPELIDSLKGKPLWGVLLSYKDLKTKENNGTKRFRNVLKLLK